MTLTDVKPSSEYVIVGVKEGELMRRLLDMGFVPGRKIRIAAKMGGAALVNIGEFKVALRENATDSIIVEAVSCSTPSRCPATRT